MAGPSLAVAPFPWCSHTSRSRWFGANLAVAARRQAPQAAPKVPVFRSVQAGTEGFYKLGCWTPVTVGIEASDKSQSAMLVFSVADADGVPCDYPPISVQMLGGRVANATGYVRFGNAEATLEAKLLTEHDGLISEKFQTDSFDERPHLDYPLPLGERLVFCVGRSSTLRQVAEASSRGERAKKVQIAQVDDVLRLPTRALGYEGVDAVVLAADKLGRYAGAHVGLRASRRAARVRPIRRAGDRRLRHRCAAVVGSERTFGRNCRTEDGGRRAASPHRGVGGVHRRQQAAQSVGYVARRN